MSIFDGIHRAPLSCILFSSLKLTSCCYLKFKVVSRKSLSASSLGSRVYLVVEFEKNSTFYLLLIMVGLQNAT